MTACFAHLALILHVIPATYFAEITDILTRDLLDQQTFRGKGTDGAGPCVCHPPSEDHHFA